MSNQQSAPNLMARASNTKRDSTRILSNLSGDSRVVPARAKSAPSRNKVLASLTVLLVLIGATTLFMQRPDIPAPALSLTTTAANAPTQTAPDTASALSTLVEQQAAQIENVPTTEDTTPSAKTNNAKPVEKASEADQKSIAKKGTPTQRREKAEDDTDVLLLTALIHSTEASASAKKAIPKKTPAVAVRKSVKD